MSSKGRKVLVQDGNVEKALRKFKKKIKGQNLSAIVKTDTTLRADAAIFRAVLKIF